MKDAFILRRVLSADLLRPEQDEQVLLCSSEMEELKTLDSSKIESLKSASRSIRESPILWLTREFLLSIIILKADNDGG